MDYTLRHIISLIYFVLFLVFKINAEYIVISEISHKSIELTTNDSLIIDPGQKNKTKWYSVKPILREYDNFTNYTYEPITYQVKFYKKVKQLCFLPGKLKPGTYYFMSGTSSLSNNKTFETIKPIHLQHEHVIQLIVRESDTYLDYLKELFNTPFILPPRYISKYGHQTDLRVGSDCAELAIYGKRRQGHNLRYLGPKRIYEYLDQTSTLEPGDIIHFGEQVSVFYKDITNPGVLDKEDLLIQSYGNTVYITTFENCGFYNRRYRTFKWKEKYK